MEIEMGKEMETHGRKKRRRRAETARLFRSILFLSDCPSACLSEPLRAF